jgi:hypothetical protein
MIPQAGGVGNTEEDAGVERGEGAVDTRRDWGERMDGQVDAVSVHAARGPMGLPPTQDAGVCWIVNKASGVRACVRARARARVCVVVVAVVAVVVVVSQAH